MTQQLDHLISIETCPKCDTLLPEDNLGLVTPGYGRWLKTIYCPICGIINLQYDMVTGEVTY